MTTNNFDRLAEGEQFETRHAGALIDGDWVEASVGFDSGELRYYVRLSWDGARTTEPYDSKSSALSEWRKLCRKHDLEKQ